MTKTSELIRLKIINNRLTQKQAAKELDIHVNTLQHWLDGKKISDLHKKNVAEWLGVEIKELLCET